MDVLLPTVFLKQNPENKKVDMVEYLHDLSLPIYQNLRAHSLQVLWRVRCLCQNVASIMFINWSRVDCVFQPETNLLELLGCSMKLLYRWLGSMAYFTYFPKWGNYIGVITTHNHPITFDPNKPKRGHHSAPQPDP